MLRASKLSSIAHTAEFLSILYAHVRALHHKKREDKYYTFDLKRRVVTRLLCFDILRILRCNEPYEHMACTCA